MEIDVKQEIAVQAAAFCERLDIDTTTRSGGLVHDAYAAGFASGLMRGQEIGYEMVSDIFKRAMR